MTKDEPIPQQFVLRTRRDMTHGQHQVQWPVELTPDIPSYSTGLEAWDGTRPSASDDLQGWRPIGENL